MTIVRFHIIYGQKITWEQSMNVLETLVGRDKIFEVPEDERDEMFSEMFQTHGSLTFIEYPHGQGSERQIDSKTQAIGILGTLITSIDFGEHHDLHIEQIDTKQTDEKLYHLGSC